MSSNVSDVSDHNVTKDDFPDIPFGKFIGISMGIFGVFGVLINALVLAVVLITQRKRFTAYKYLMCHLALADLMCSLMLGPYIPLELAQHNWIYDNKDVCQLIYPMISCFTNVATGTILLISMERYRGIVYPYRAPWRKSQIKIAFIIVWIVSVVTLLPNSLKLRVNEYKNIDYCNEHWENKTYRQIYGFSYFAVAFAGPLILIAIMHVVIMIRLKSPALRPDNISEWQNRKNKRITRVLTGIIIAFLICVCPNKILYFVWDLDNDLENSLTSKARFYMRTFQVLYYARVAADPLIYCFFDTRFNNDLKKTLKTLKGESSMDDIKRIRSASQRTTTMLSVRSRANSAVSGENSEMNGTGKHTQPMACIYEVDNNTLSIYQNDHVTSYDNGGLHEENLSGNTMDNGLAHKNGVLPNARMRSDTVDTDMSSQHGSSSPLFNELLTKL